jgi:phosphoribosylamine---glycine ligase
MKFLMISVAGEGAGILKQIQDEGNEVSLHIQEKVYKTVYDGILPKADKIEPDEDEIIIFDMSGNGNIADDMRDEGYLVYGASGFSDQLEKDRQFGLNMMKACGIKLPETQEFDDFEDATPFLDRHENKKFVFKPSGSMPCKLTYCSEDNEDLLNYMKFVAEKFGDEIESFVLQEFVEGDLVSSEIFCDGKRIIGQANHTVEAKKFMNCDVGPSTGCSGNIVWLAGESKIAKDGVMRLKNTLIKENFIGQIDLNAVVNENGVFGLEWTPRFGYDATPTYLQMIDMEYGKFFSDIVRGQIEDWDHKCRSMCGIRMTIPPYPAEPEGDPEELSPSVGIPIQHWETYNKNLYFFEVMKKEEKLVHAGGTGVIACVIHKNPQRCYEILERVKVPDKQYRTDLVEVLGKMKKGAEKWQ